MILFNQPIFKIQVRWLRGRMYPVKEGVPPSFDRPESFTFEVVSGIVKISLSELANLLNTQALKDSPLKNISLSAVGNQIRMKGTVHKGIPLPIELIGDLSPSNDQRIHIHIAKLRVLKIPVKGLLNVFHVQPADMIDAKTAKGIEVQKDDIYLNPDRLLPPPHQTGKITDIHVKDGDIVEVYGDGKTEGRAAKPWRNFMSLTGGSIQLGRLTMANADIVMIDISQDNWFSFDLMHYQKQVVNGYVRVSPTGGLQIFMPDSNKIKESNTSLRWVKDRNTPPPASVPQ